jgi:hypothetical protein
MSSHTRRIARLYTTRWTPGLLILLLLALTVVEPPANAGSESPQHRTGARAQADTSAARGLIRVTGVASSRTGLRLRNAEIRLTLFGRTLLLDKTTTGPRGGFSATIIRTPRLTRFARNHSGRINVMVWGFTKKRSHVRILRIPYHPTRSKRPVDDYPLGRTTMLASKPRPARGKVATSRMASKRSSATQWMTIGTLSATRSMTSRIEYYANLETSYQMGVYLPGKGWTVGGTAELNESSGAGVAATMTDPGRRKIQIEVESWTGSSCSHPGMCFAITVCYDTRESRWTGGHRDTAAPKLRCVDVPAIYQRWRHLRALGWEQTKVTGRAFRAAASLGSRASAAVSAPRTPPRTVTRGACPSTAGRPSTRFVSGVSTASGQTRRML